MGAASRHDDGTERAGGQGAADGAGLEATCRFVPWLVPTVERFPAAGGSCRATAAGGGPARSVDRGDVRVLKRVDGNRRRGVGRVG